MPSTMYNLPWSRVSHAAACAGYLIALGRKRGLGWRLVMSHHRLDSVTHTSPVAGSTAGLERQTSGPDKQGLNHTIYCNTSPGEKKKKRQNYHAIDIHTENKYLK